MPDYSSLQLLCARVDLRPLVPSDAPALFAIFSNSDVMRYWSSTPWQSLDVSESVINRDQKAMAEGKHLRLGIVERSTGDLIGTCSLFDHIPQCRRAEVGFGLSKSAWGRGYAAEAVRRLISYGFEDLNLNRVEADIDPRNTASARCLERLGFSKEGHLRQRWIVGGEVSDSALYGVIRSEWGSTSLQAPRDA